MEDKKYPISLEVLTPMSAGAGNEKEWIRGLDFIQKDGKVYVIDIQKAVSRGVDANRITELFLKSDERGISQLLGNQLEEVSAFVFDAPASTKNNIKTFLRTQLYDKPIIPGSSIKGAVRSTLFHYLRDYEEKSDEVFGTMKDGTDLMRFIRIADIEMPSTILVNTKIFNLRGEGQNWQGGWKHEMFKTTGSYNPVGFNTLYECVAPGQRGYGNITLAANAFQLLAQNPEVYISHSSKKRQLMNGTMRDLFAIINTVTKGYLLKERAFFEKYATDRTDEITDNIDALLAQIPDDDSCCLLKMSAGVGFHSITGDWQFDDYDNTKVWPNGRNAGKKKYKSRKTAEYNGAIQLMGFVKISQMGKDEALAAEQRLCKEHRETLDGILGPLKQRDEEQRLKLIAEQQRREAALAEKQKQEQFRQLFEESKVAYAEERWIAAKEKAKAALKLYPDDSEVIALFDRIVLAKNAADYRAKEADDNTRKYRQPLSEVIKGKTSAGNLIGTLAKWLKTEGNAFGSDEYAAFLQEAKKLSAKELKNVKNKRKDLIKAVGEESAQRILGDLKLQ